MFSFSRQAQRRYPTIREALVASGVSAASDRARVIVIEKHGQYAGRQVNFFRAFEPGHEDRLLGSGHVEREGMVIVDSRSEPEGAAPVRQPANSADHVDDEHLIFWDADAAKSSVARLSAPAATWLHARSTPRTSDH